MKTHWLLWLMGLTPWLVFGAERLGSQKSHRSWEIYHGDCRAPITPASIRSIDPTCISWNLYGLAFGRYRKYGECNPIIVGDTMFVTTPRLHCVALDAVTEARWRFDPWQGGGEV